MGWIASPAVRSLYAILIAYSTRMQTSESVQTLSDVLLQWKCIETPDFKRLQTQASNAGFHLSDVGAGEFD